jgi:hypothetical protein
MSNDGGGGDAAIAAAAMLKTARTRLIKASFELVARADDAREEAVEDEASGPALAVAVPWLRRAATHSEWQYLRPPSLLPLYAGRLSRALFERLWQNTVAAFIGTAEQQQQQATALSESRARCETMLHVMVRENRARVVADTDYDRVRDARALELMVRELVQLKFNVPIRQRGAGGFLRNVHYTPRPDANLSAPDWCDVVTTFLYVHEYLLPSVDDPAAATPVPEAWQFKAVAPLPMPPERDDGTVILEPARTASDLSDAVAAHDDDDGDDDHDAVYAEAAAAAVLDQEDDGDGDDDVVLMRRTERALYEAARARSERRTYSTRDERALQLATAVQYERLPYFVGARETLAGHDSLLPADILRSYQEHIVRMGEELQRDARALASEVMHRRRLLRLGAGGDDADAAQYVVARCSDAVLAVARAFNATPTIIGSADDDDRSEWRELSQWPTLEAR